jgi:hypothetical protein
MTIIFGLAYKAYRDGICDALGIEDDPKHLTGQYEQERRNTRGADYLEFEVIPFLGCQH